MCRIVGYWDFNNSSHTITSMKNTMFHGGPDDDGEYYENNIAFGHRRLSIIDLSNSAHQPMISKNKQYILVFNGEIYNYKEIKTELIKLGHTFNSNSDTEVVLHSYIQWGEKCTDKFDGMWAFAIRDIQKNIIFLSRDRVGIKPLYWYFDNEVFLFASELKAFKEHPKFQKEINKESLYYYFKYGYIPSEKTIFKNCYKLEASSNLIINHKQNIKKKSIL